MRSSTSSSVSSDMGSRFRKTFRSGIYRLQQVLIFFLTKPKKNSLQKTDSLPKKKQPPKQGPKKKSSRKKNNGPYKADSARHNYQGTCLSSSPTANDPASMTTTVDPPNTPASRIQLHPLPRTWNATTMSRPFAILSAT